MALAEGELENTTGELLAHTGLMRKGCQAHDRQRVRRLPT